MSASRRHLLGGLVVGAAGAGFAASAPTTSHADTYLIALCTEFVDLEHMSLQMFEQFPDDNEREDGQAPIRDRQDHLAEMIEGLTYLHRWVCCDRQSRRSMGAGHGPGEAG